MPWCRTRPDYPERQSLPQSPWPAEVIYLFTNAAAVDDAIKFVSDKSSISIEPELEKEKHKVDDAVTVDKKHSNNDIQRSEEEEDNN